MMLGQCKNKKKIQTSFDLQYSMLINICLNNIILEKL